MTEFQRTMRILAALGIVACVSAVLFYWNQFRLLTALYNTTLDLQEQARMWRQAFIEKPRW